MSGSLTLDQMRADVAARLGQPADQVGLDADLLELGLDSIGLMRLAAQWGSAGASITFAELIEQRTLSQWWDMIQSASEHTTPIAEVDEAAPFPLAPMQHAYWVGRTDGQLLGGVGAHFYCEFDGADVRPGRLERALAALAQRHPMLRCRFLPDATQQIMAAPAWSGLAVRDLRGHGPAALDAELDRVRDELSHSRLDVARGKVLDVSLSLLPAGARVHVKIEMLVADAESFRILLADLAALYQRPDQPLPPVGYSYPRYRAIEAAGHPDGYDEARAYWQDRLATLPPGPELPAAHQPGQIGRPSVARRFHWMPASGWAVLAGRAREHGVTLSMVFLTAFAEVLAAWSARPAFTLNLPLYNRRPHHPDVSRLAGDFTSLLLLEIDAASPASFASRARAISSQFASDTRRSAYSGVDVLRDLARACPDRAVSAPVVFTSALSLGELFSADVRECLGEPGWTMSQTPQVWLDCQVTEREGGLFVNWDVAEDLLADGVVDAMFGAFTGLLDWLAAADWAQPVPPLIPRGQRAVRAAANGTLTPLSGRTLHQGFFEHATATPGRVALTGDSGAMSYGELADAALRLAAVLIGAGVQPGDLVGVCLPKGPGQVIAVLAVLAAGGAYVPVGVDQPAGRRQRILDRAGVHVMVGADGAAAAGVRLVSLDQAAATQPLAGPVQVPDSQLAYVIFTSGSTGEPKGVQLPHRAAVNTIEDIQRRFGISAADRVLAVSALDFDLSVFDMFALLGAGGAVVTITEEQRRDARAWLRLVRRHQVTIWQSVPALLDMLLIAAEDSPPEESPQAAAGDAARAAGGGRGGCAPIRLALLGGDWVGLDLHDRLTGCAPGARLIALGGTTETAIHSTVFEVTKVPAGWRSIPYGRPLHNQLLRIVDSQGRDCPDWVPGELWIGGASVADGYRGDPGKTAAKFGTHDGVRWYHSGDLGRYWPDGTMEFLGREDFQVKVGGHRIELGEIEAALRDCPGIREAVAVTTGQPPRLAAMVTGQLPPGLSGLLADRLPGYMIPQHIEAVDVLPLSPNGKINRPAITSALAAASQAGAAGAGGPGKEPPQGSAETALAAIWAELLHTGGIGRDDSFFALGGDSLLATRLLGRLRAAGLHTPGVHGGGLRALFASPRLRDFAALLRPGAARRAAQLTADPAHRREKFPPTDVQRAYWMGRSGDFTLGAVGSHWYWEFDGEAVNLARLEQAWNTLVRRHEMLRAVFGPDGQQRILPEVPGTRLPVTAAASEQDLADLRERLAHRVPDPTTWPVAAIEAARYGDDRVRIAFSFDYILLDALSIVIVFAELAALYRDPAAALPPVDVSFRDYLLTAGPDTETVRADQEYWSSRLAGLPPAPQLPLARDPQQVRAPRFTRRETRISPADWHGICERAREHGVTPASALATAFATVLAAWSTAPDLTLNLTLFDRREVHPDIDHILGDFTSLLLVSHQPPPGGGWLEAVRRFTGQVWSGMEHNAVSAIWVLRELARRRGVAAVSMPVVFTSALGVSDELAQLSFPFGEQVWGISQTPQVWLDCQVMERGGGLSVNWDVVEELFPEGVLDAMFAAYGGLLGWLASGDWSAPLPDLLPASQRAIRATVNGTATPLSGRLLHQGFFEHAAATPDRIAITGHGSDNSKWGGDSGEGRGTGHGSDNSKWGGGNGAGGGGAGPLTYGELATAALRVAAALAGRGVQPGDPVGVCLPKGPGQVIAVLGVLAAGGAYVPAGVDQPPLRRDTIFARAGVRTVIAEPGAVDGALTLAEATSHQPSPGPVPVSDGQLAYVIFTSGSTGEPKGVEITHRAAVNTIEDIWRRFGIGETDRVLAVSALDFDLSVFDIFGLLGAGGAVVTITEDQRRDPRAWLSLIREHQVTVWNTVPALLDMLLHTDAQRSLHPLRLALVSGDWVGLDLGDRLTGRAPGARLIALGGATEAAIWSNFTEVRGITPGWRSVPYGRPLANQRFRVVDSAGRDCPDWVAGELWIGGEGVAAGYRGDPARSAERFVTHAGTRWYRTGDLGRYRPDGTLEFLGRADFQVKIGGHRIELGEIEAALRECPGIQDAAAVTTGDPARLAAMVAGTPPDDLAGMLADRLPGYMIPQLIEAVDALPLSANGKTDRAAIIRALDGAAEPADGEPPRDGLETELAAIWAGLLRRPVTGRGQSFFALGGDSLLATRLVETIRDCWGAEVPLRALFAQPTVAGLATTIEAQLSEYEEGEL